MFELDEKQTKQLCEWLIGVKQRAYEKQGKVDTFQTEGVPYYGAIGGGLTYSFTPTSLGTVVVVKEMITGEEINLTDFDSW